MIKRIATVSYKEIEPITLTEGEKEINFKDVQKSATFLYKGIAREKSAEISNILKNIDTKFVEMNLNLNDYELYEDVFESLYFNFYDVEWDDAQDALVDLIAHLEKYLSTNTLNTIAWHYYKTQKNLEKALELSQ